MEQDEQKQKGVEFYINRLKDKSIYSRASQHHASQVRMGLIRRLSSLGDTRAIELLISIVEDQTENIRVRQLAAYDLGVFDSAEAVEFLVNLLQNEELSFYAGQGLL